MHFALLGRRAVPAVIARVGVADVAVVCAAGTSSASPSAIVGNHGDADGTGVLARAEPTRNAADVKSMTTRQLCRRLAWQQFVEANAAHSCARIVAIVADNDLKRYRREVSSLRFPIAT